jgi:hypothetical protein
MIHRHIAVGAGVIIVHKVAVIAVCTVSLVLADGAFIDVKSAVVAKLVCLKNVVFKTVLTRCIIVTQVAPSH